MGGSSGVITPTERQGSSLFTLRLTRARVRGERTRREVEKERDRTKTLSVVITSYQSKNGSSAARTACGWELESG